MHTGSCLCGAIAYELESDLKAVVNCHCKFCRRAHGAPFTTLLFAPAQAFRIVRGEASLGRYRVARLEADRCFCRECGTRLYNDASVRGRISVIAATLDIEQRLRPLAHVNTESKDPAFEITDGLPQFPAGPGPEDFKRLMAGQA